jgi:hypothetical protein
MARGGYVQPQPPRWRLVPGFLAAAAGFGLLAALWAVGTFSSTAPAVDDLRRFVWPGALTLRHSTVPCEGCHVPRAGVTNFRCQRCHDEAAPGRLTQAAHLGRHLVSLDRRARAADDGGRQARAVLDDTTAVECVHCHIEHRGSSRDLRSVEEKRCLSCHADGTRVTRVVDGFGKDEHPDHWMMKPGGEPRDVGTGMSQFSHYTHLALEGGDPSSQVHCARCHQSGGVASPGRRDGRGTDFAPLAFTTHCAECHKKDLAVKGKVAAKYLRGLCRQADDCPGETLSVPRLEHRDPRVLADVRRLRYRLWPEAHLRELSDLRRQEELLRMRLERLADPLEKRDPADLKTLLETFRRERAVLDAALARSRLAGDPLARVREIAGMLPPSEAAEVDAEMRVAVPSSQGRPVRPPQAPNVLDRLLRAMGRGRPPAPDERPGIRADFEDRRAELLLLLEALERVPAAADRARTLRVRLMRLTAGELSRESLLRARAERAEAIGRIEDELRVRGGGAGYVEPPAGLPEKLQQVVAAIADLDNAAATAPDATDPAARGEMEDALAALTGTPTPSRAYPVGCAYCHEIRQGTFEPMRPAARVLGAAEFRHEKHLSQRTCQGCHGDVVVRPPADASADDPAARFERARAQMARLHLKPITSCQECHRFGAQRRDCLQCHRYHVPAS